MRGKFQAWRCGAALLWLLLCGPALSAPQPWLALAEAGAGPQALNSALRLHVDRDASQGPAAIQALPESAWMAVDERRLTPGYSSAAYWLRLQLHNPGSEPQLRWLLLRPARLESVSLYQAGPASDGLLPRRAGTDQPFAARELPLRESAFVLALAPGERQTLWLRVASRSAIALDLSLWPREALLHHEQTRLWLDGMVIGFALLLMVATLLMGLAQRERAYAYVALYLGAFVFYESGMRGTAFMLFWPQATDWAVRALGSFGVLAHLFELAALTRLLDTARFQPRWHRGMQALALLDLLALGLCFWGDYRLGTTLASLLNGGLGLLMAVACVRAVRQRRPLAWAWGAAVALHLIGLLPRVFSLLGWQPHSSLVDYAPPFVGLLGCLVVLLAMLQRVRRQRLQHEVALESAVQLRTRELLAASARAQASDAAKGRLLGYLGHDLRAPLASVVQLARRLQPDAGFEQDRRAIEHGSQLLLEMIDELQRFARAPTASAAPEVLAAPCYLHGLLLELHQQAQGLARSNGNRLRLRLAPELPSVLELDAKRLRQALFNLLSNAAKFTRDGQITLGADYREGRLCLTVADTGPGIAAADQALLFEPFVRPASSNGIPGLGLGLSIARQTVLAMGGSLELHSRPGEGCRFELSMPAPSAEEAQVDWPALRGLSAAPLLDQGLALVLDACDSARQALSERLSLSGYDCLQAASLAEAMALDTFGVEPALLIVEPASLPRGDLQSLAALRRRHPGMRLICCSARPAPDALLYKPAPEHAWWAAMQSLSAGRHPSPSSISAH
ncbi:sensor histidine kinase [Paucibacter sp. XJ19-41]|uniref:sensor histidine kinase n=1 Tax=Paucibacter sp. XJ19-41 TaxID=2927824 RepID=UPI00234A06BC|nr:sensor histidine kinase [Paucibacter sp. XJ19-41]MDC6167119.1 sensor histidine kinase [Paucibacter sp. XJ19-41]